MIYARSLHQRYKIVLFSTRPMRMSDTLRIPVKRGQAAESAWRKVTEAEAAQNREEWGGKKPGWQPEGEIPSYILKDGAYPQMDSLLIGEKYEQFNEKGENVSRTVIF